MREQFTDTWWKRALVAVTFPLWGLTWVAAIVAFILLTFGIILWLNWIISGSMEDPIPTAFHYIEGDWPKRVARPHDD